MQGLQALGQGGEIAVRGIPRPPGAASARITSTASRTRRGCFFFGVGSLALRMARRILCLTCPAGRKPVSTCGRPAAARRTISSSQRPGLSAAGTVRSQQPFLCRAPVHGRFPARHGHGRSVPTMRRAACAQARARRTGSGLSPFPAELGPGALGFGGRPWRRHGSWSLRSRRPSRHRDFLEPGFQQRTAAAASPQASRRSWASSACTAAAARLVSPAPYASAPKLLRGSGPPFPVPVGVTWTASSVSAPRLFHWASALHWGANSATAAASRPCGAPYSERSTQRVSSAKSHQPLIFEVLPDERLIPVPALRRPTAGLR